MGKYSMIRALRRGEIVDLNGSRFKMDVDLKGKEMKIREGDLYIAGRNSGPELLEAAKVVRPGKNPNRCCYRIQSTSNDSFLDIHECVKIVEME